MKRSPSKRSFAPRIGLHKGQSSRQIHSSIKSIRGARDQPTLAGLLKESKNQKQFDYKTFLFSELARRMPSQCVQQSLLLQQRVGASPRSSRSVDRIQQRAARNSLSPERRFPKQDKNPNIALQQQCIDLQNSSLLTLPLPRLLNSVERLSVLILDGNLIEVLPLALSSLSSLTLLSARNNRISKVYRIDGQKLLQLQTIDLSFNELRTIEYAQGFHTLIKLSTLKLESNPVTHVEAGVLSLLCKIKKFTFDWGCYVTNNFERKLEKFAKDFTQNQPADFLDFLQHCYLWEVIGRVGSPPLMQTPSRAGKKYTRLPMKTKVSKSTHTNLGSLTPFKNGRGLIHKAVEQRHGVLLDFMLSSDQKWTGFDVNIKDNNNRSPLSLALAGPEIKIIKVLHKHGALFQNIPPSATFIRGDSILFETINLERFTSAQFLIDQMNVSIFPVDLYGNNLLHLLFNKLPKMRHTISFHEERKVGKISPLLPQEETNKKAKVYEEAHTLAITLCNLYGYQGINYLNNNELTPLHNAIKKNKEHALDFALSFNEIKRKERERYNEELLFSTLKDSRTPIYHLNFSKLVSQIKTNEAPPFDFNVRCGRRNQSLMHFLSDVENYNLLIKIVNHPHVIEELDMHATDSQFSRPIDIPVIRTPVHKLLQFVERQQSRRVRYSGYHKLKHYVGLFYGDAAHMLVPLWNRRSPAPPVIFSQIGLEATVEKMQQAIQLADTGDSLQSEWLLRIQERMLALEFLKQISLMKAPSFKSPMKGKRLPSRKQVEQYLKSLVLPKKHTVLWIREETKEERRPKKSLDLPLKNSNKTVTKLRTPEIDKRKPSLTIQDFRNDTPPLLFDNNESSKGQAKLVFGDSINTPTIYPDIDLDEGVGLRKIRNSIKESKRDSQLARRSGRWSNWYKFHKPRSRPSNFNFEMTPQITRKEDEDSPPPSTERAHQFSESPVPKIYLHDTIKQDCLSQDLSIVRTLFPFKGDTEDSQDKDTVLAHEKEAQIEIDIEDILSERISSPQGLERVINENCILRKHESVTRKLDFKIKQSSSQDDIPGYATLVEILSRKEDKLSLFSYMRKVFLEAQQGVWSARQLLLLMASDKRRAYMASEAQHLMSLL